MLRRAVFLDRDGVINESIVRDGKPYAPTRVAETIIVDGARQALAELKRRGFLLLVVTNQPNVRRESTSRGSVEEIHRFLSDQLPLDDFFVCYHDDGDNCRCRKPKPGLLLEAAGKHDIDVKRSFLIGDRWRDIHAGVAAGCRTIFIDHDYQEPGPRATSDFIASSLPEAVNWILDQA